MARALLRLTTRELAQAADVSKGTIISIEAGRRGHARPVERIREYFEAQGVYFIPALKEMHGPAVALRWGINPAGARPGSEASERDESNNELDAKAWDEEDEIAFGSEELADLRRHFSEAGRWNRLSDASKKAISRALGNVPFGH